MSSIRTISLQFLRAAAAIAVIAGSPVMAQEVSGCGHLQNGYGPFDYRDPTARAQKLPIVEAYHFTPNIESLVKGESGFVIDELDYTLRAFPNHHRALISLSRFALGGGKFRSEVIPNADCYFRRAIALAPDDEVVRILFGNYLYKRRSLADAREQYETALRLAPESPEINYNAALFYLDVGEIETASRLASVAYAAGYPLEGLRKRLEDAKSGTPHANRKPTAAR